MKNFKEREIMNSQIAIEARELGKAFRIYKRKRDRAKQMLFNKSRNYYDEHWALRKISFELQKGESLGIVGKNGSGKSTLLQLICGTLKPSEGSVCIQGKIAALLELGSGFNPDFSGRENVYLNAALLGLTKNETEKRMDKILDFADIGDFIDQPVRTYSSGMVVRLAFAVIVNVDADILVIDEALAVGDAYFTQKCMRFIQRFRKQGSLIFVSHDANAVLSLCDKAVLLKKGELVNIGTPKEIIEEYTKDLQINNKKSKGKENNLEDNKIGSDAEKELTETEETRVDSEIKWSDFRTKLVNSSNAANHISISKFDQKILDRETFGGERAEIKNLELVNISGKKQIKINGGEIVNLRLIAEIKEKTKQPIAGFILKNDKGLTLLGDNALNSMQQNLPRNIDKGTIIVTEFTFTIPMLPAGEYSISASIADGNQANHEILHWINDALLLRSQCTNIAAGLAGVPMHSIKVSTLI